MNKHKMKHEIDWWIGATSVLMQALILIFQSIYVLTALPMAMSCAQWLKELSYMYNQQKMSFPNSESDFRHSEAV